ncbi:MAG: hypothetical protein GX456_00990 [Verrucomicrobia bacterium]|nr:hypothetical protein [Verrucomicrobiota bacterium]
MGVGRREAFGVRQLAAALFPCPNNVSVPISTSDGFLHRHRQHRIGTRDNLRTTPQSGAKTQIMSLSHIDTSLAQARVSLARRSHRLTGQRQPRHSLR